MITFLLLSGCLSIPDSIPRQQGTVTAELVPDLMSISSPDLPYLLITLARTMADQDYRTCPQIVVSDTTISATADGCDDSAQITWTGTMTYSDNGDAETVTFSKFGISHTEGDWLVTGTLSDERTASFTAEIVKARLAITSNVEPAKDYWLDTTTTYTSDGSDYWYADTFSGTIGMEAWGLADISGAREYVPIVNNCYYGSAGAGSLAIEGANRADLRFHEDAAYIIPSDPDTVSRRMPPPPTTDTGYSPIDTGTTDTGTTDTGPFDSGTTDTGGTDTGNTTPGTTDEDSYACGCATVNIGDSTVSECTVPTRAFAYPIVALAGG